MRAFLQVQLGINFHSGFFEVPLGLSFVSRAFMVLPKHVCPVSPSSEERPRCQEHFRAPEEPCRRAACPQAPMIHSSLWSKRSFHLQGVFFFRFSNRSLGCQRLKGGVWCSWVRWFPLMFYFFQCQVWMQLSRVWPHGYAASRAMQKLRQDPEIVLSCSDKKAPYS